MDTLILLLKEDSYVYSRFSAEVELTETIYNDYQKFKINQKRLFKLKKSPKDNIYEFGILIPEFDQIEKNLPEFKEVSDFFEKVILKSTRFSTRVSLHYAHKDFRADPELPVQLDDRKNEIGKLVLSGVRITFPDYKEFESVILDVQPCPHCQAEALNLQIFSERTQVYSIQLLSEVIKRSLEFSQSFIKRREK